MIETVVQTVIDLFSGGLQKVFLRITNTLLGWVNTSISSFWHDDIISGLINISKNFSRAIFFVAFIVMIIDILEDRSAEKPVYPGTVIGNIFKGLLFVELAPIIGQYSMEVGEKMLGVINLSQNFTSLGTAETILGIGLIDGIAVFIALVYFFVATLKRYSIMLIQILQATVYIPSIVRGDTTAMGGWLRQATAIILTYFFQYLLFYLGLFFFLQRNLLPAISMWLGMSQVPRVLDKFGLSMGSGGGSTVASLAQTGLMLAR